MTPAFWSSFKEKKAAALRCLPPPSKELKLRLIPLLLLSSRAPYIGETREDILVLERFLMLGENDVLHCQLLHMRAMEWVRWVEHPADTNSRPCQTAGDDHAQPTCCAAAASRRRPNHPLTDTRMANSLAVGRVDSGCHRA